MFQAVWPAPAAQDATFKPKWASTRTVRFRAYGKRIDSVQGDAGSGKKAWSAGARVEVPHNKRIEDDMLSTAHFEFTEATDDVSEVTALELHISPYLKNGTWIRWLRPRKQFRRLRALTAGGACTVISFLGGACELDEELCLGLDSVTFCLHDLTGPVKTAFQLCAATKEDGEGYHRDPYHNTPTTTLQGAEEAVTRVGVRVILAGPDRLPVRILRVLPDPDRGGLGTSGEGR